jgi:uncharacterized membrane-anchored protein YhcB (DUF1043 family)
MYKIRDNNLNLRDMKKLVVSIALVVVSAVNVFSQYSYVSTTLPDDKYNLNYLEMNVRVAIATNNTKHFSQDASYLDQLNKSYNNFVKLDDGLHDLIPDTTKNLGSILEYLKQLQPAIGLSEIQEIY